MKNCSVCKQQKIFSKFPFDRTRKSGYHSRCKECQKKLSRIHYLKNKASYLKSAQKHKDKIRRIINGHKLCPCIDCEIQYPPWVMQFDHVRGEKLFTIGTDKWSHSISLTLKEIEKCEVVCANCHSDRTYKRSLKVD